MHDDLKNVITNLISVYWSLAISNAEYGKYWELLKCKIRSACITYGKRLAIRRKCEIAELSKTIADITEIEHVDLNEKSKLNDLQNQLDIFYEEKARGASIRSRK